LSEVDAGSREDNASKQEPGVRFFEASHPFSLRLKIAATSVAAARAAGRNAVMLVRSLTRKRSNSPHDYGV
jgi:hypothetical protein